MAQTDSELLTYIEIEPPVSAKHSVIVLHGLGADGSDFVPIIPELRLPENLGIRFVFPSAPVMPVSINNGYRMRAWYDITPATFIGQHDEAGINKSMDEVDKLIANEVARGIPSKNIVLAGFSQGAVIALTTGLRSKLPLGGIIALSGYLPLGTINPQKTCAANQQIPIFIAHGTDDSMVPYALGKAAYTSLQSAHYPVTWHSYPVAHTVCAEEVNDISQWLQRLWR